ALLLLELGELGALRDQRRARRRVVEVDAVAVPAQLPRDHDRDDAHDIEFAHVDLRRPERARDAADATRIVTHVEHLERTRERRAREGPSSPTASSLPRFQPWCAARGAHSSQTVRGCPAARKISGLSPRSSRRSHTSHAMSGWEVTSVREITRTGVEPRLAG